MLPTIVSGKVPVLIVVAELELVEPIVNVLIPPPLAIPTVVLAASEEKLIAPVPERIAMVPAFELMLIEPVEPDCKVVAELPFVLPTVKVLVPAPFAIPMTVEVASDENEIAPVPDKIPKVPPLELTLIDPVDPDCNIEEEVELVLPRVSALTAAPFAIPTTVAAESDENEIAPTPESMPKVPPLELMLIAPAD